MIRLACQPDNLHGSGIRAVLGDHLIFRSQDDIVEGVSRFDLHNTGLLKRLLQPDLPTVVGPPESRRRCLDLRRENGTIGANAPRHPLNRGNRRPVGGAHEGRRCGLTGGDMGGDRQRCAIGTGHE